MDIKEVFCKIVHFKENPALRNKLNGVFILRTGLIVPLDNMVWYDWQFTKWDFLQCRINAIWKNGVTLSLLYYPDGKINIIDESEYDIVDFIEADEVEYLYYDYELTSFN